MKRALFLILLVLGNSVCAQKIEVISIRAVNDTLLQAKYYPKFTPNGSALLLTSENYKGLEYYNLFQETLTTLATDLGAGFNAQISTDGKELYYLSTELINKRKYTSLKSIELSTGIKKTIQDTLREFLSPTLIGNKFFYLKGDTVKSMQVSAEKQTTKQQDEMYISVEPGRMLLYKNGKTTTLAPCGRSSYVWPSISPDRTRILFTSYGKTYICNLDGSNLISLGRLSAPTWLNNNYVIGMDDRDNGYIVTSSQIIVISANGQYRQELTDGNNRIDMYPSASADASKIVFNTIEGKIYIINIAIKD